ncbi:hypothetical protein BOTNAR_0168g00140 [Botryotinia narcissicola]|uniref:Uncharacterized protein n=1 Tax=Botryotinia narcissicola TaxID=278944 RepID=A0A4Z1IIW7_9HELO|nr:hypothetical protein BOTNAR_0168g00140 [Botryotinia narcissicola]
MVIGRAKRIMHNLTRKDIQYFYKGKVRRADNLFDEKEREGVQQQLNDVTVIVRSSSHIDTNNNNV